MIHQLTAQTKNTIILPSERCKPGEVYSPPGAVKTYTIERLRRHSQKPDEQYERIERLVDGPYLELFARQKHPGWDCWGNEVKPDINIEVIK